MYRTKGGIEIMEQYESKAIVTSISASSRASVKVKDSYYTVEYSEERSIPDVEGVDIEQERAILWDIANGEVDRQIQDILDSFSEKK
jgi:hypothetical protein